MKIKKLLFDPLSRFRYLSRLGLFNFMDDKQFLKKKYHLVFHKELNLDDPKSFNEKLQWLKLHDRRDIYTTMVDKYEAKRYVSDLIGEKYIIPTIGVYNRFEDIDFNVLPNQFVIKCTHDSGGVIICKDKSKLNLINAKRIINKCLKRNYYYVHREWPYKNVKPRIIIEKYMEDDNSKTMRDYKFFCFNGRPEIMYLSEGLENHETAKMSFYDMDMLITDCARSDYLPLEYTPEKPRNFEKMKMFSSL